jgi:hypothetical protein
VNAPIRPRKPATTVPDFLIACAGTTFAMAAVLIAATLFGDVIEGGTGKALARAFAGCLLAASLLLMAMALLLLRDERGDGSHYWLPLFIGIVAGSAEAGFFLAGWGSVLWLPPLLLLLAFRPVRRMFGGVVGRGARR